MSDLAPMSIASDLMIFEISEWKQRLLTQLNSHDTVTLDLAHAGNIDASGLQLMMAAHRTGKLLFHDIPTAIADDLRRLGWEPGVYGA